MAVALDAEAPSDKYYKAAKLADALQRGEDEGPGIHYKVDEKQKSVLLTEEGYEAAEDVLGVSHKSGIAEMREQPTWKTQFPGSHQVLAKKAVTK